MRNSMRSEITVRLKRLVYVLEPLQPIRCYAPLFWTDELNHPTVAMIDIGTPELYLYAWFITLRVIGVRCGWLSYIWLPYSMQLITSFWDSRGLLNRTEVKRVCANGRSIRIEMLELNSTQIQPTFANTVYEKWLWPWLVSYLSGCAMEK